MKGAIRRESVRCRLCRLIIIESADLECGSRADPEKLKHQDKSRTIPRNPLDHKGEFFIRFEGKHQVT